MRRIQQPHHMEAHLRLNAEEWTNRSVYDFFSPNESKQDKVRWAHISAVKISPATLSFLWLAESHRRTRGRLCTDSQTLRLSDSILDTYPYQPDTNTTPQQKGCKDYKHCLSLKMRLTGRGGPFISPKLTLKLSWTPLICRKKHVVIQISFVTVLEGFHRNPPPSPPPLPSPLWTLKHPEPHQQMVYGETEGWWSLTIWHASFHLTEATSSS